MISNLKKTKPGGCFFLDANVVLSDIVKENTNRIEKFKKDAYNYGILCYISNSVKEEIKEKIQRTTDFLGNILRQTIKYQLEEFRKKRKISLSDPIDPDDIKALEVLFSYYHDTIRKTKTAMPTPFSIVEEWIISFLGEKIDKGIAINIDELLAELVKNLLKITSSITDLYDYLVEFEKGYLKVKNISPDSRLIRSLEQLGFHKKDATHIASVILYQLQTNEKAVFVTLDFSSILSKREELRKKLKLECSDPLYAIYHLM